MSRTIFLKGRGQVKEGKAGGAITPGHLIVRNAAGNVVVHATAAQKTAPMFAMEADFVGKEITTAYATNDRVQFLFAGSGDEVYALLPANAAAIVIGDLLESNGDGTLRKYTPLTDNSGGVANTTLEDVPAAYAEAALANNFADLAGQVNRGRAGAIAVALEAVDNSAGGTPARIKVEVL